MERTSCHPAACGRARLPEQERARRVRPSQQRIFEERQVAQEEEQAVAAWKDADPDRARIIYRRRTDNTGYKAGNVRDFCARWGKDYALMLPLDADSLMSGDQIVRLVRMMQAHPKIGILQSLVVGMPSASAFANGVRIDTRSTMDQQLRREEPERGVFVSLPASSAFVVNDPGAGYDVRVAVTCGAAAAALEAATAPPAPAPASKPASTDD